MDCNTLPWRGKMDTAVISKASYFVFYGIVYCIVV
jgi:hypothetical protein